MNWHKLLTECDDCKALSNGGFVPCARHTVMIKEAKK